MKLNPKDPNVASLLEAITLFVCEQVRDATTPLKEEISKLKGRLAEIETKGVEFSGSWQRSSEYRRGMMAVHEGSLFACIEATSPNEAPGTSPKWVLAAKAGRDARETRLPTNHSGRPR
jgi:hypothetical protein